MSTFQFGVRDVELAPDEVERHRRIAHKHGITFHYVGRTQGTPTTGWFSAPNRGEPFDRALANQVLGEVRS